MFLGIALSLAASLTFGYIYYFSSLLIPLSGEGIFAYRVLFTYPFLLAAVFVFKQRYFLSQHLRRLRSNPKLWFVYALTASITGFEMWLFLWAPNHNQALSVSVGYLILPLVLVIVGRVFLGESLTMLKNIAVLTAALGVGVEIFSKGGIAWPSIAVCGYAVYFALRKHFGIADFASFVIENTLLLPICFYIALQTDLSAIAQENPAIYWRLILLGILSGAAFVFYINASDILPVNLLGLLSYIEPLLLLVTSFVLGAKIEPSSYPLFVGLLLSIVFVLVDGVRENIKQRQ